MIRALILVAPLALLSACAGNMKLTECDPSQPALALNNPALEPAVWDDGQSTFFRFPGNSRIPTFYTVNPDGTEAVVDHTVNPADSMVVVHRTAREFKLRDGAALACIHNGAWNPVGYKTGTGTTSPDVTREPRATR